MTKFKIEGEYIELMALLKVTGLADTGGMAGIMITQGEVMVNGVIELRKRYKVRSGDKIQFGRKTVVCE